MKAIMLSEPRQIGVVALPDEHPGPGEVTLRIESCSVGGSDLEGFHGIHPKHFAWKWKKKISPNFGPF